MYTAYFNLSSMPFENNLEQRFLYLSETHEETLAALLYFVKEKRSFAMICGDVGTGKTMLIQSFLKMLPNTVTPVMVSNPAVGYLEIIYYLADRVGVERASKTILQLLDEIRRALIRSQSQQQQVVLIIDEAHLLSTRSLEHVRLLSNIETETGKLLQILLAGQHELSQRLSQPDMRQLRQRININRFLSPLTLEETIDYIDHRLRVVGSCFEDCFEENAKNILFRMTNGVPREINRLCDNSFMICSLDGKRKIDHDILVSALDAARTDQICMPGAETVSSESGLLKRVWRAFGRLVRFR